MVEDAESEVARMKVITIIEDGERARSVYVRADGDVTVFDRDRKFRFRCDIAGAKTTWQIMARVTPHVVAAEAQAIEIETLADRCRTGWLPVAEEIDANVPQRTMLHSGFGVDLLRYNAVVVPKSSGRWASRAE